MKTGETIGTCSRDNLIVDGKHSPDVKGVTLKFMEAGTLERGTLLTINEDGNAVKIVDVEGSHQKPDCILADNMTGEEGDTTYTAAYKSGNFAKQTIEDRTGITLTDEDVETLRGKGIFIEGVME